MSSHNPVEGRNSPTRTLNLLLTAVATAVVLAACNSSGSTDNSPQAVGERIQPVGSVTIKLEAGAPRSGEEVFKAQCSGCHGTGALGAPKFGDAAAWGPRIATGFQALLHSALNGKNNMPKQGGGDFSDLEVARGVVYMTKAAGGNFPEPKAGAEAEKPAEPKPAAEAASN